jgi:DNA polymerase-3 subunit alpha
MFLIFDTETTGLPNNFNAPLTNFDNWPRVVQLAWQLHAADGSLIEVGNHIIKPDGFNIPFNATKIHGITTEHALEVGKPIAEVLQIFAEVVSKTKYLVGHNIDFDIHVMGSEYLRVRENPLENYPRVDTCTETTAEFCKLPGGRYGRFKLPSLTELHKILFEEKFSEAHNASADVEASARVFFELVRKEVFLKNELPEDGAFYTAFHQANPKQIQPIGLVIQSNKEQKSEKIPETETQVRKENAQKETLPDVVQAFAHLRNYTEFSILSSKIDIKDLVQAAFEMNMPAVGITDTGNLMAAFQFVEEVNSLNKKLEKEADNVPAKQIKAVLGCEFYVCKEHKNKSTKDDGDLIPIYAKNKKGYANLSMLSSISYTEGMYYKPRIDKELLMQYKDNLLVTTGGLRGEIPNLLLNKGESAAEEALLWWKEQFGADFYIELNRHGLEEENYVNDFLLKMAKKHGIKYFASNSNCYVKREDAEAHDFLLCVRDNTKKAEPIGRGRGFRFGLQNDSYYFKSQKEMHELFKDIPESFATITEILDKIEPFTLKQDVALPEFKIPDEFIDPEDAVNGTHNGENNYLHHIAYEGARKRYGEITEKIQQRLDFELHTIKGTGFPGYFLIVSDLIAAAREKGVWVGPGRGSAAGSLVAYCIWITDIDPLKYGLLFERFLNPERISLPDIDIDFDDEGRSKVIDYVIDKYGKSHVAQIVTYGTLGTKSAIRDVGRVLDVDLADVNKLAASTQGVALKHFFILNEEKLKDKYRSEQIDAGKTLRKKIESDQNTSETKILKTTLEIEGRIRNTGIHACGYIIAPSDLRSLVPVMISKDADLWVTQFDNHVAETAGLLKVDFLGLKTLSLIRDTIEIIRKRHNIEIVPNDIPLDDLKTYELFQRGETIGVFQYESPGMQKHLKDLKPTEFADLIAMNALYRPGPMAYIPQFIDRKHGREEVVYDLEEMSEFLEETYGVTVYQEQVMLLSQKLAGFTKGQADTLRKAMGKKQKDTMAKMKALFIEGCIEKGHPKDKINKIWGDWESFAEYAFNKSHSTCYAYLAFQTAYLKAHYPAEFMASVLSNNIGDIKQVTFFIEECNRIGIKVLGPDVNESEYKFTVNEKGEIRFGLGAIRNMGESAAEAILTERQTEGVYTDFLNFLTRINLRVVNKRNIEALAKAGAFDSFKGTHRAVFFHQEPNESQTFLEKSIRKANQINEAKNSPQLDMFGSADSDELIEIALPIPECDHWSKRVELSEELDSIGFYISAHPIDEYRFVIKYFTNSKIPNKEELDAMENRNLSFAGQIVSAEHLMSKNGNKYGRIRIEDKTDSFEIPLFTENYLRFQYLMVTGTFVLISGVVKKPFYAQKIQENGKEKEVKCEFHLTNMQLLDTLIENSNKKLELRLNIDSMNQENMTTFINLIHDNPGKQSYSVKIIDPKTRRICSMIPMKNTKINAQQLLPLFEQMEFVTCELK